MPKRQPRAHPEAELSSDEADVLLSVAQWRSKAQTAPVPRQVIRAAVDIYAERPFHEVTFSDICTRAKAPKASAYRYFPNGIQSLVEFFHRTTVISIVKGVHDRTRSLPRSVEFRVAVDTGVRGGLDAMIAAPWTSKILVRNRDMLTGYLLSRDAGGILNVLSDYAARCAANFGSEAEALDAKAERFVWDVFSGLLCVLPDPPEPSAWRSIDDRTISRAIDDFVEAADLRGRGRMRQHLAVPPMTVPMEMGSPAVLALTGSKL